MRLLFLVSSLPISKIGGTEIMTLRICEQLARAGTHEPFIYTIAQSEDEKKEVTLREMCAKYDITHLPIENIRFATRINDDGFLSYTRANLDFTAGMSKIVDNVKPDLVITMKIQPPDFHCSRLIGILHKYRVPFAIMIRGFTDLQNSPVLLGYAPKRSVAQRIQDWYYYDHALPDYLRHGSMVISQTSAQSEFLNSVYGIESQVIFNPIDHELISERIMKNPRSTTDTDPSTIRLIYVGSMISRKNVPSLFEVMELLDGDSTKTGVPRYELTVVGGGRRGKTVTQMVGELRLNARVHFPGKLPPEELWPLMAEHDIFVFPSLSEGFPNVLLEAMACGLPIVSTRFLGVEDIIRSDKNGRICPLRDAEGMAGMISDIVEDGKYQTIGEHNREFVKQFTWKEYMNRLEGILQTAQTTNRKEKGGAQ